MAEHMTKMPGVYPTRYSLIGFPSAEQFEEMIAISDPKITGLIPLDKGPGLVPAMAAMAAAEKK